MLPREKLIKYGPTRLEEYELLSIILGVGSKDEDVFLLSKRILESLNNIKDILDITYEELISVKGIKCAKATKILASIEFAKRIFSYNSEPLRLDNPTDIYSLLQFDFLGKMHEEFFVLFLDKRLRLIKKEVMAIGAENIIHLDFKKILKTAIKCNASNLVLAHNHPNGSIKPSESDIETTKKLKEAALLVEINIIDHLIIAKNNYYSFLKEHII